jgi:hypothetical protein
MSPTLSSDGQSRFDNIYQLINEVTTNPTVTFESMVEDFLRIGLEFFNMRLAIVSEVEEDSYFIYAVGPNPLKVEKGMEMPLGDTLCKAVFEQKRTITHFDMSKNKELVKHPAYKNNGLRSYMGAPIWLGKKLFGTLNFSAEDARKSDYEAREIDVLTTMTSFLSKQLEIDLHSQKNALMMKNLTHELRSPLNGIVGSTEILTETELDQEQFELIDLIKRSSNCLEESVKDLSLFIKVNRELNLSHLKPFYPIELTKELLKRMSPHFRTKNITFKHDESRVSNIQVSSALYQAAIRAILSECQTRQNDRIEIEISYAENERYVQIIICDNGPRLTKNVTHVINSFGRIEFSQNSFTTQGLNLNLTLASILLQLAGGHMRVFPIKKEDNQFVLSFPKEI